MSSQIWEEHTLNHDWICIDDWSYDEKISIITAHHISDDLNLFLCKKCKIIKAKWDAKMDKDNNNRRYIYASGKWLDLEEFQKSHDTCEKSIMEQALC